MLYTVALLFLQLLCTVVSVSLSFVFSCANREMLFILAMLGAQSSVCHGPHGPVDDEAFERVEC